MNEPIINPGEMRWRVILQRPVVTSSSGIETRTFEDVLTVAALIDWGTGREFFAARGVNAAITQVVTIYTYKGLTSVWRLRYDENDVARFFGIVGVKPLGVFGLYSRLECTELVGRETS